MQMWMIAMLAVSAVLIVRDMAKLIFTDRKKGKPVYDVTPRRNGLSGMPAPFSAWLIPFMRCRIPGAADADGGADHF